MGGQIPDYADQGQEVNSSILDQAPYSPADSDLGVQEILVERSSSAPIIFDLSTAIFRTDNAPSGNPLTDESSWVSSTRMALSWRPHLIRGWFADVGIAQDILRYDRKAAVEFENMNINLGVFKILPDLDDTVLFARYEYQRITSTSLSSSDYYAQRIRAGLQKVVWAAPRHQVSASLSGSYEWKASPTFLERNEVAFDAAYRYSFTDTLYTRASGRIARYNFDQGGRDDWTLGLGVELIWQINSDFKASASLFYDKNDSDSFGNFNEYDAWTSGVGVGIQLQF